MVKSHAPSFYPLFLLPKTSKKRRQREKEREIPPKLSPASIPAVKGDDAIFIRYPLYP